MDINSYAPKRIFLGLILAFVVLFSTLMYYLWHLGTNQETAIYRFLFTGIIVSGFIVMGFISVVLGSMVVTILRAQTMSVPLLQNLMRITIGYFFPIVMQIGKVLRIQKNHIMQSFIQVNNQMVLAKQIKVPAEDMLMLLPHCVQDANCKYKITRDIDNCKLCGKCPVNDLITLSSKHGINMRVATGGTLARQIVKSLRPRVILAVACERDLVSGIIDSMPLPVYGILNVRPNGPCFNTHVIIEEIEKAIEQFKAYPPTWSELNEAEQAANK
ncbi:DUF116 domain-containing protein [Desulfuribacillus alkaliarsenatis]|uniref:DUF116 domain-containing protein n=1 Tax=Desulfuribacillus alkaliarsenatis TaxID=766136 RepID=A0A1E5G612_9FIRM|nr:DUF116 domain-containing protein [Desulfuribacillus alkaliarsenatis]OEF98535.1 hypothetical protein BHF68_02400 [Desulfuribacillus alkaliarsenatis]